MELRQVQVNKIWFKWNLFLEKNKKGISSSHNNGMEGEVVNLRFIGCLYNTHKKRKTKTKTKKYIYIYIGSASSTKFGITFRNSTILPK